MPKGKKQGTWERCTADLMNRGCRFRLYKRSRTPIIQIREVKDGQIVDQFSSQVWRYDDDEQIHQAFSNLRAVAVAAGGHFDDVLYGFVPLGDPATQAFSPQP